MTLCGRPACGGCARVAAPLRGTRPHSAHRSFASMLERWRVSSSLPRRSSGHGQRTAADRRNKRNGPSESCNRHPGPLISKARFVNASSFSEAAAARVRGRFPMLAAPAPHPWFLPIGVLTMQSGQTTPDRCVRRTLAAHYPRRERRCRPPRVPPSVPRPWTPSSPAAHVLGLYMVTSRRAVKPTVGRARPTFFRQKAQWAAPAVCRATGFPTPHRWRAATRHGAAHCTVGGSSKATCRQRHPAPPQQRSNASCATPLRLQCAACNQCSRVRRASHDCQTREVRSSCAAARLQ